VATLIVLAIASLANPLAVLGNCNCIFTTIDLERPSLNEREPDDARAALGLLVLSNGCYSPTSNPSLAGRLGIGG